MLLVGDANLVGVPDDLGFGRVVDGRIECERDDRFHWSLFHRPFVVS
jgi:hypothetical protein